MVKKLSNPEEEKLQIKKLIRDNYKGMIIRQCKDELIAKIGSEKYRRHKNWIPQWMQDRKRGKTDQTQKKTNIKKTLIVNNT